MHAGGAATTYLTLSFNSANPTVASNALAGIVVATITASWTDGSPFIATNELKTGTVAANQEATRVAMRDRMRAPILRLDA
jgi:hypothetical protein